MFRVNASLFLGLALLFLAAVLPIFWPPSFQHIVNRIVKLAPGKVIYESWIENPVPLYLEFYLFNWTNHELLESEGEMHVPEFQEVGPFRFNEVVERVNVTWNANNTLTSQQARWWYFDPLNSKASLQDNITSINIVALTAAFKVRDWSYLLRASTSTALGVSGQQVHMTRTAGEILFEGYSDSLVKIAYTLPSLAGMRMPMDKFAWFYKRNGTLWNDGVFNMNTGEEDMSKSGDLQEWNYSNQSEYFTGQCAEIRGSLGNIFPPGLTREDTVYMFSPDMCKAVALEYEEDASVNGVPGYKYAGGRSLMHTGSPETACLCTGECPPPGTINVTACKSGAPVFASFPHFYLADPYYTESIKGMRPKKEDHQMYFTIEPNTGVPLDVAARFQINTLLQPIPGIALFSKVPTVFFPVVWLQERAHLTPSLSLLLRPLHLLKYMGLFLAGLAALAACFIFIRVLRQNGRSQKNKEDSKTYVTPIDATKNGKNDSRYIVMTPKRNINDSVF